MVFESPKSLIEWNNAFKYAIEEGLGDDAVGLYLFL